MWKLCILHHASVFIVGNRILWHRGGGPSDYTGSHENWFQGYKIDLITHKKLQLHNCANKIIFIKVQICHMILLVQ